MAGSAEAMTLRHHAAAAETVARFARVDLIGAAAGLVFVVLANAIVVRSSLLWIVPPALALLVVALAVAVRRAEAQRTLSAILLITAGNWFVSFVVPIALPFLWPIMILVVVMPLVAAAPHVPLRALVALIAGAAVVVAAVAFVGLDGDDGGALPDVADELELAVVVVALAALMVPIALVVWQNNRSQRDALDEALRLNAELDDAGRRLVDSRRRIVESEDVARRRIERDLHDGAQQRLVALGMKARLVQSQLGSNAGADASADAVGGSIAEMIAEVDRVVEELRELARGIAPPTLEAHGLVAALDDVARRAGPAVSVEDAGLGGRRLDASVERALYFVALEAITNATKHAPGADVHVSLRIEPVPPGPTSPDVDRAGPHDPSESVVMQIADAGPGFDPASIGDSNGLVNMADRIDAAGGRFEVRSGVGHGTTIAAHVPI